MTESLLADIGGSKSRFALANSAGRPELIAVVDNDTVADLDAAVASYLEETGARPRAATLAVAGPVDGEEVVLTNRTAWRFRRGDFARRYGFSRLRVVNDFEAIAWALPRLGVLLSDDRERERSGAQAGVRASPRTRAGTRLRSRTCLRSTRVTASMPRARSARLCARLRRRRRAS